jgi:hypothetical protein
MGLLMASIVRHVQDTNDFSINTGAALWSFSIFISLRQEVLAHFTPLPDTFLLLCLAIDGVSLCFEHFNCFHFPRANQ